LRGVSSTCNAVLPELRGKLKYSPFDQALNDAGGVVARAADRLNIRRTTLVEKMRKYDMHRRTEGMEDFDA